MERFNYPNIAAVEAEDGRILAMLEAESWGRLKDEQEEQAEREEEMEQSRLRSEHGQ
jgi:hypothetical protein